MMTTRLIKKPFWVILLFVSIVLGVNAQGDITKSQYLLAAKNNAQQIYFKSVGEQSALYNGKRYYNFSHMLEGHQFYGIDNNWGVGSIMYCNNIYTNIKLKYDIVNGLVIIAPYVDLGEGLTISLINEKLSWFTIDGYTFHKLPASVNNEIEEGAFYQLLFDGNTKVYAKRKKIINEQLTSERVVRNVTSKNAYYVSIDDKIYKVNRRSQLFNYPKLSSKEAQLKKYCKAQDLKFRKNFEASLVRLVEYYDTL